MYVWLDLWWVLTILNYSPNIIPFVFIVDKASWDMMPFRVVSRFLVTEDGTCSPAEMSQLFQSTRHHMPVYFNLNSFAVRTSLISHVYLTVIYVFHTTFRLRVQIQEVF